MDRVRRGTEESIQSCTYKKHKRGTVRSKTCTFQVFITPSKVNQATIPLLGVLSGKPSASGAEMEGAILLKNDPAGDLRRRGSFSTEALIPY